MKRKADGKERLFKLVDIARGDARHHYQHGMFYYSYYFTWVVAVVVALVQSASVKSFSFDSLHPKEMETI
jgi:hypothetical protein